MFEMRQQAFAEPYYRDFVRLFRARAVWIFMYFPIMTWALVLCIRNPTNPAPFWAVVLMIVLLASTPVTWFKKVLNAKLSVIFKQPLNDRKSVKLVDLLWSTKGLDNLASQLGVNPLSDFASRPNFDGIWNWNRAPIQWFDAAPVLETCKALLVSSGLSLETRRENLLLEGFLSAAQSKGIQVRLALEPETAGERVHAFLVGIANFRRVRA